MFNNEIKWDIHSIYFGFFKYVPMTNHIIISKSKIKNINY